VEREARVSPKLHLAAHGFKRHTTVNLDEQPAPSVCATGFGSYDWWIEMPRLKIKKFGVPEAEGRDEVDLSRDPSPAIMGEGIGGVGHGQYEVERDVILCQKDYRTNKVKRKNISKEPAPGVRQSSGGMWDARASEYWLEVGAERCQAMGKPPYLVPSMAEVGEIPWNGLKVASTFSGAGGSCLGYRMAGYRVVWANEFVPAAQETYEANADPGCVLDRRDIKDVRAEEILEATGLKKRELDLFDGSPPCQAFSTAGKREKGWGTDKVYEHGASQRNEDLFYEYIRLLRGLEPLAFVAENVAGLVRGVAKGYFLDILAKLKESGYLVEARILDAKWLGVPQSRQRVIFVGVREDLGLKPRFPVPLRYLYSVTDACPWIGSARYDTQGQWDAFDFTGRPAPAIIGGRSSSHNYTVETAKGIKQGGWSDDRVSASPDQPSPAITARHRHRLELESGEKPGFEPRPRGVRKSRALAGSYENFHKKKDVTRDPCPALLTAQPNHYMVEGDGSDAKNRDDHGTERRRFTILEVKRICSFPDDFVLTGTYGQQWERMGNSVPPLMMRAIAEAVRDGVLLPKK
jgi:DNA (cytosine-5)-methyltransferase 1